MTAELQSQLGEEEEHGIASAFELAAAGAGQTPSLPLSKRSR